MNPEPRTPNPEPRTIALGKYSFGIGDRFGKQGAAQLAAFLRAPFNPTTCGRGDLRIFSPQACLGGLPFDITPVWNKSFREHTIIGTKPADVRAEADDAVKALGWDKPYFVDADHIGLHNVDRFIGASDFFTLDVADYIGAKADEAGVNSFVRSHSNLVGTVSIEGLREALCITAEALRMSAARFLLAAGQAAKTYRYIKATLGSDNFVVEVSMDETDRPQTPVELLLILAALADEHVPVQTIAPKFSGRFNKGVDYVGDIDRFAAEFEADVAVLRFAVHEFGLPANLKLSVHSGSDKFAIYGVINRVLRKFDAGIHIKTAGTTWLAELEGLATAGGEGLALAKEIYARAFSRLDELCAPYAAVIDIDKTRLPDPGQVTSWDSKAFVAALRHDKSCRAYDPNMRQLLHVGYKIAAEMGTRFLDALDEHRDAIAPLVTSNIYQHHMVPVFAGPLAS